MRRGIGLIFGVTGIAAGFAGTALNRLVDPDVLLLAFAGVILLAAAGMFPSAPGARRAARNGSEALVTSGGGLPDPGHLPGRARKHTGGTAAGSSRSSRPGSSSD